MISTIKNIDANIIYIIYIYEYEHLYLYRAIIRSMRDHTLTSNFMALDDHLHGGQRYRNRGSKR